MLGALCCPTIESPPLQGFDLGAKSFDEWVAKAGLRGSLDAGSLTKLQQLWTTFAQEGEASPSGGEKPMRRSRALACRKAIAVSDALAPGPHLQRLRGAIRNLMDSEMDIARAEDEETNRRFLLLMEESTELQRQNDGLRRELVELRGMLASVDQERLTAAQRAEQAVQQALQEGERAQQAAEHLARLGKEENALLRAAHEQEMQQMFDMLEHAHQRVAHAEAEFARVQQSAGSTQEQRASIGRELQQAQGRVAELQAQIRTAQQVAEQAQQERQRVQQQLESALRRLESQEAESRAQAEEVEMLKAALRQARDQIGTLDLQRLSTVEAAQLTERMKHREHEALQRELVELRASLLGEGGREGTRRRPDPMCGP